MSIKQAKRDVNQLTILDIKSLACLSHFFPFNVVALFFFFIFKELNFCLKPCQRNDVKSSSSLKWRCPFGDFPEYNKESETKTWWWNSRRKKKANKSKRNREDFYVFISSINGFKLWSSFRELFKYRKFDVLISFLDSPSHRRKKVYELRSKLLLWSLN